MERVLAGDGIEVVREDGTNEQLVAAARRLRPDTVVLGMSGGAGRRLGCDIRTAAPGSKVILWAEDEDEMEVFDAGSATPRRIKPPLPRALVGEFVGDRPSLGRK
jgi:DNA-binding NarL/FixJ family response regulator